MQNPLCTNPLKGIIMTDNNIFVKYPELKELFNFKKGFFKGFSVTFSNGPASVITKAASRIDGAVTFDYVSNSPTPKDKLAEKYFNHCKMLLEFIGLNLTKEILKFVEETYDDVWYYYQHKFSKAENVAKDKLEFDHVKIKRNGRTTKFIDKYGDVRGITIRESSIKGILSFGTADYGRWVVGYLGNSNDLEEVINNFLGYRELNERQTVYLRQWLNRVTVGV